MTKKEHDYSMCLLCGKESSECEGHPKSEYYDLEFKSGAEGLPEGFNFEVGRDSFARWLITQGPFDGEFEEVPVSALNGARDRMLYLETTNKQLEHDLRGALGTINILKQLQERKA